MNAILTLVALLSTLLSCQAGIRMIIVPDQCEVGPSGFVDVSVYLTNEGQQIVETPSAIQDQGFSRCGANIKATYYKKEDSDLEDLGTQLGARITTPDKMTGLKPNETRHYRFRWSCPELFDDFDFVVLVIELWADDELQRCQSTILRMPIQD
ncbi:MAG: hypothetical protein O3A92_10915 [Verrucomicrobia bacterium]|nr:hypothetical protein [Verrucomicrobiota bacterium]